MSWTAGIAAWIAVGAIAGLLLSGGPARRWLGFSVALAGLVAPPLVSGAPLVRYSLGLVSVLVALRAWDLLRDRESYPLRQRLWHVLWALFDSRRIERIDPNPGWEHWRSAAFTGTISLTACAITLWSGTLEGPLRWGVRYGAFAVFALASFETGPALARGIYGWLGIAPPPMHDRPFLSRSIGEFWGVRWNKVIGAWLREYCYLPLAERGHRRLGMIWAFVFSALFHTYMVLVALGWKWAALYGAFFIAQIPLVVAERALGVRRWPGWAARAWTVGVLLVVSPLFAEPMIVMIDGAIGPWRP